MARCDVGLVLDFDSIGCRLEADHEGMHRDAGEGGDFEWKFVQRPWASDATELENRSQT